METQLPSGSVQLQRSFAAGVVTSSKLDGKIGVDQGLVIKVQLTDFDGGDILPGYTRKARLGIKDGDGTTLLDTSGHDPILPINISSRSNVIKWDSTNYGKTWKQIQA